jgi:hypothetical protein
VDEADSFNFNKYWGPDDYRPRVVFRRGSDMQCVYCGEAADTREHCPSKVFLAKPYPSDLPVVPACEKCNNGFSADELYTRHLSRRTNIIVRINRKQYYQKERS